uniref:Uncharacterized protein n=1 Tax=Cacopsylla melanoneura TaxID=428564 RepID=A0A8D9EQE7_9HEMI
MNLILHSQVSGGYCKYIKYSYVGTSQFGNIPSNFPNLGQSSTRSKREEAAAAASSNPFSSFQNLGNNPLSQISGANNPLSQYAPQGFDQFTSQFGNIPSNFPGIGQSTSSSS